MKLVEEYVVGNIEIVDVLKNYSGIIGKEPLDKARSSITLLI
ncbi:MULTISPECIES: hypothetical protein [Enterococcus]|nr:hypothetical protein [Enterococcus faecalis]